MRKKEIAARPYERRRREDRIDVDDLSVSHITTDGIVRNVSSRGLAVEYPVGLRIGARYRLEIRGSGWKRVVVAIVRWCRLDSVRPGDDHGDFHPRFLAGLEIDGCPEHPPLLPPTEGDPRAERPDAPSP